MNVYCAMKESELEKDSSEHLSIEIGNFKDEESYKTS